MHIRGAKCLRGDVVLPGDKSISHRAAMLGAIAGGRTRIENFASSEDCASTLECLRQLGVGIERDGSSVMIHGVGKRGLRKPEEPLDCGNSGTTMRLLAGILAGQDFDSVLTGDGSLRLRPMQRIAAPLAAMGAQVETTDGHPPLKISGGRRLRAPTEHVLSVASAQVKSCILFAGLYAGGETVVVEPTQTRDHTERMLRRFGVRVERASVPPSGQRYSLSGDSELLACEYTIPGDISAASFFLVAAACLDGSDITMRRVGLNPTRADIIGVLKGFGARIDGYEPRSELKLEPDTEPTGDVRVTSGFDAGEPGNRNVIKGKLIPNVIDEIPILGVLGTQLKHGIEVRDAAELRVKESDRISAVVENLKKMNAVVEEFDDGFLVRRSGLVGARVDSYGDHRIAMAFSIAGLLADGETEIDGAECVAVSFPGFFDQLQNVAIYE